MFKNSARSQGYEQAPPPYESESSRPFLGNEEEGLGSGDDDMFKDTVANSSVEIRMRKCTVIGYCVNSSDMHGYFFL